MPSLSFKKRFAGKIRNGQKRQTIRTFRKYPIKPGDTLYLYTGLRTKYAKKLREVKCKSVSPITIYLNGGLIDVFQIAVHRGYLAKPQKYLTTVHIKIFHSEEHGVRIVDEWEIEKKVNVLTDAFPDKKEAESTPQNISDDLPF